MIWFDLVTPKSVMFFREMIFCLQARGKSVLVTTRTSPGYEETVGLLELNKIEYTTFGEFGGGDLRGKLRASLERQFHFMEYIAEREIESLVTLCSVDANRVAFGLGIPIVNFYDIPLSDYKENFKRALPQARLTIPLSTKVFRPFVVPREIFLRFSVDGDQIHKYQFLDPLIWLKDFKPDRAIASEMLRGLGADPDRPFIVVREEEYKACYVAKQYPFLYEAIPHIQEKTGANIVIIPRYEHQYLKQLFPSAYVLEKKVEIQHLLAFANLFIGGGGTINIEATYFGTPTISTRSFISHYDKYLIDTGLMVWANDEEGLVNEVLALFDKDNSALAGEVFGGMTVNLEEIIDGFINLGL
ncbi:MAG: DUF354 domain-containing protein [Syntrophobacteraceae bacterium]